MEVIEEILPVSARVIVNMASMKLRREEIEAFFGAGGPSEGGIAMIPITHADGRAEQKLLRQLKARSGEVDRKVTAAVTAILDNVRQNGDRAVENYTLQFDGQMPEHILVERPEMEAALDQCDSKFVYALYQRPPTSAIFTSGRSGRAF